MARDWWQRRRASTEAVLVSNLPPRLVYRLAERRYRMQEPELRHVRALADPARGAIDVGAWLGPWTRALSRATTHVHAFEPQPRLARFLTAVTSANVTVHEAAVGAEAGAATLVVDPRPGRDATASVATVDHTTSELGTQAVQVPMVRLDDLSLGDIGFVKIDVEGHEEGVLDGAEALLEACRPALLIELEQRHLAVPIHNVIQRLLDRGRTGWFLDQGRWQSIDSFDVERHQLSHVDDVLSKSYVNNFLFLHGSSGSVDGDGRLHRPWTP